MKLVKRKSLSVIFVAFFQLFLAVVAVASYRIWLQWRRETDWWHLVDICCYKNSSTEKALMFVYWKRSELFKTFLDTFVFSRESDSRIANVRPYVRPLVSLSVCLISKPLSLSELLLSNIESIAHRAYQLSSLSTIEPIDHWAYQPSSLSLPEPTDLWSSFATFKPFGLFCKPTKTNSSCVI